MKKVCFLFILCGCLKLSAQNSGIVASMTGISDFKINMKKGEVEKLTGKTLKLQNLIREDWALDSFICNYKGVDFLLIFTKDYAGDSAYNALLYEVGCSDVSVHTPSGITIGDDKLKIVSTYDGYSMTISPEYENDYTVKSKTKSIIWLSGNETSQMIVFHLFNNKVQSISVSVNEGD